MRVPKEYTLPNLHVGAEHYVPPRTTNPLAAERRKTARGTNALILEQQGFGLHVAQEVLDELYDTDEEHLWAQRIGGVMLLSANYTFNLRKRKVMSRRIPIPVIASQNAIKGNMIISNAVYERQVELAFEHRIQDSADLSVALAERKAKTKDINGSARSLATLGVMMANYPMDPTYFYETENAALYQAEVVGHTQEMHADIIELAREIGTVPSLAQLADVSSPLSSHLRSSRRYPIAMVRALKDAQEDILEV